MKIYGSRQQKPQSCLSHQSTMHLQDPSWVRSWLLFCGWSSWCVENSWLLLCRTLVVPPFLWWWNHQTGFFIFFFVSENGEVRHGWWTIRRKITTVVDSIRKGFNTFRNMMIWTTIRQIWTYIITICFFEVFSGKNDQKIQPWTVFLSCFPQPLVDLSPTGDEGRCHASCTRCGDVVLDHWSRETKQGGGP